MEHRMLGIACVVGAVTIFVLQDALIKWLSGGYPLHEIVLVRAVSAVSVTLVVMRLEGGIHLLRTRRLGLHLARAGLLVIANSAVCLALAAMTIAGAADLGADPGVVGLQGAVAQGRVVAPDRCVEAVDSTGVHVVVQGVDPVQIRAEAAAVAEIQSDVHPEPGVRRHRMRSFRSATASTPRRRPGSAR